MNKKRMITILTIVMLFALVMVGVVSADDGPMFRRNVSKTPEQETERANLMQMAFYVPAQSSAGVLTPVEYFDAEGALLETREYAKPLIAVYIDGLLEEHEEEIVSILSGAGFGAHDAYAALSLDDGSSWKRTNLSNSAELSSFVLNNGHEYPGDAHNMTFAIAGDKVLVGWISKYCDGGSPLYAMPDEDIDMLQTEFSLPDLYVHDIWGVAGDQKSVDYTFQGFPEVGEIPYSCVWAARGQLLEDIDTGLYDIVWTKAERLTSGRRDANRLEMNGDSAAGFMMTWQEDPDGLRPGQGLGPGEGWSGAVVNQQTDLWYSFISMEDFVMVMSDDSDTATAVDIAEYTGVTMPKVAVPMAMPIRLTDNKMCKGAGSDPYCYIDFQTDAVDGVVNPYYNTELPDDFDNITQSRESTFCYDTELWTTPSDTTTLNLCVTEDERVLGGRVGASRPRVNVQPYNSLFVIDDTDDTSWYDSGIVIMGAEESKALGEGNTTEDIEPEDIGKNMWYYTFDLLNPSFVMQGGMLNQPAVDPETETFFELLEDDFLNPFYETEIARRFSHFSQPIHQFGPSGVSAVLIVKQGIINQGGPADIFLRMTEADTSEIFICDADGDGLAEEQCLPEGNNPYAYENLICENLDGTSGWEYLPGDDDDTREGVVEPNPRYVQGLCTSYMINVSGTAIEACDGAEGDCADAFPWDGAVDGTFPKVTEWSQSGPDYGEELTEDNIGTLDDQSWENPYDVSKGHRGYIDGDFIMMMYAWSPNWQANSVGNDHYNLYARRSFDGGKTWTTLPAEFLDTVVIPDAYPEVTADGTETCENYKNETTITTVCTPYGEGEFEQARNLSQLIGNKVTILDPRYTPTGGIKMLPISDLKEYDPGENPSGIGYADDERDPSKFFIVYETGDNTTVAEGEAVPLDLFYSRATNWGDDYFLIEYANAGTGEVTLGFDWLEHDREDLSGEAANLANNGGTYYYAIWNQWQEDEYENVSDSDAIFRRIYFEEDLEKAPVVTSLYASSIFLDQSADDELLLVGTGQDRDRLGQGADILNVKWLDEHPQGAILCEVLVEGEKCVDKNKDGKCDKCEDLNGNLICDAEEIETWACEKTASIKAVNMTQGMHKIHFAVKDNEEVWSEDVTIDVYVFEELHQVFLPVTMP